MRKIIVYMTTQKKIKQLLMEKTIPETYPRNYSDIKVLYYNPQHVEHKIKFNLGLTDEQPKFTL